MKRMIQKFMLLIIAMISLTIFSNKVFAVSISFEISGDIISEVDGFYYPNRNLQVGEKLNIKAEEVTHNDMYIEGRPMGETSRRDITDKCKWYSSNESVAKVSNGVVEAISDGYADITVTYDEKTIEFYVIVGEKTIEMGFGEGFYITQKDEIKTIKKGNVLQLDVDGWETLSNIKNDEVTWSSSDEQIARVDSKGLVTAIGAGKVIIKAELKTENKTYQDTYDIEVTNESKNEFPYDFFIDKKQLNIDVGSSEKLEITAKLKDGYVTIAQYEEGTDNWDVTWKVEDESIAKCTPEKGIVNDIHSGEQIAGRATIQGLKAGNTNLLIKVKIAENQFKEFSVPMTIKETQKDEPKEDKEDEPKEDKEDEQNEDKEEQKKDDTITDKNLPKTGENNFIIISIIAVVLSGLIYFGIMMKKK